MEIFGALPTYLQQSTYRASASVSKDWLSTSIRLDFHFVRGAAGLSRKLRFCELHPDHLLVLRPNPPEPPYRQCRLGEPHAMQPPCDYHLITTVPQTSLLLQFAESLSTPGKVPASVSATNLRCIGTDAPRCCKLIVRVYDVQHPQRSQFTPMVGSFRAQRQHFMVVQDASHFSHDIQCDDDGLDIRCRTNWRLNPLQKKWRDTNHTAMC